MRWPWAQTEWAVKGHLARATGEQILPEGGKELIIHFNKLLIDMRLAATVSFPEGLKSPARGEKGHGKIPLHYSRHR